MPRRWHPAPRLPAPLWAGERAGSWSRGQGHAGRAAAGREGGGTGAGGEAQRAGGGRRRACGRRRQRQPMPDTLEGVGSLEPLLAHAPSSPLAAGPAAWPAGPAGRRPGPQRHWRAPRRRLRSSRRPLSPGLSAPTCRPCFGLRCRQQWSGFTPCAALGPPVHSEQRSMIPGSKQGGPGRTRKGNCSSELEGAETSSSFCLPLCAAPQHCSR